MKWQLLSAVVVIVIVISWQYVARMRCCINWFVSIDAASTI